MINAMEFVYGYAVRNQQDDKCVIIGDLSPYSFPFAKFSKSDGSFYIVTEMAGEIYVNYLRKFDPLKDNAKGLDSRMGVDLPEGWEYESFNPNQWYRIKNYAHSGGNHVNIRQKIIARMRHGYLLDKVVLTAVMAKHMPEVVEWNEVKDEYRPKVL